MNKYLSHFKIYNKYSIRTNERNNETGMARFAMPVL